MYKKKIKLLFLTTHLFAVAFQGIAQESKQVDKQKIDALVSTKMAMERSGHFKDRFTIQLFYGARDKAITTKREYDALNLAWESELKWVQPNYAIWVGTYRSRLEANRALLKIKKKYKDSPYLKTITKT